MTCCGNKTNVKDTGWCWVMLLCVCVIMFLVFGVHYSFGILYPNLLKEFNKGEGRTACVRYLTTLYHRRIQDMLLPSHRRKIETQIHQFLIALCMMIVLLISIIIHEAWVGSLSSGFLFLSSFFAIKLCELTSVTTVSLIGSICSGLGLILTSLIQQFDLLYLAYGTLFGIGTCFLYTPCLIMIARWFDKYQVIATGVAVASASLGAFVISPIIEHTIRFNGFRSTVKTAGILYLFLSLLCSLAYKPLTNSEEENEKHTVKDGVLLIHKEDKQQQAFHLDWTLFKNKSYVIFLVVMIMTNFTYFIPMIHLVHYAEHLDVSSKKASLLISIWSISNIFGRLLFGKIATIYRNYILRIYQIAMLVSGIIQIGTFFATTYWMLVSYVVLCGFLDGSFVGLMSIVILEIVGLNDLAQGYGIFLTTIGLPIALGPPVVGMINDTHLFPPQSMFLISGIPFVIGSLLMTFVIKFKSTKSNILLNNENMNLEDNNEKDKLKLCNYETSV